MRIAAEPPAGGAREQEVVARAQSLVPTLRAQQAETDRLAAVPPALVDALEAARLFAMTVPREYGGLETSIETWMAADAALGSGDGGVAWAVTLINACNWMAAGLYPRAVSDEIFAKPNTRVAGVFSPRGVQARPVRGGIVVDKGIWFFNSGVYHAHWDLLGVPTFNAAGEPTGPGIAAVPMSDVTTLNDWDSIGLRGSGSTNVSMAEVFIPDERIVRLLDVTEGRQASGFPDRSLYRSAFAPLMVIVLTFPVVGIISQMMELFLETLPKRDIKLTPYTKQGEAPVTHIQVGQAGAKFDAATLLVANASRAIDAWAASDEYMPLVERARLCRDAGAVVQMAWEGAEILVAAAGGSFSRRGNALNRLWQELRVAGMHPFVAPMSNFEMYGRLLCGVEPLLMPV